MVRPNNYTNNVSTNKSQLPRKEVKLSEFTGKPITDVLGESF